MLFRSEVLHAIEPAKGSLQELDLWIGPLDRDRTQGSEGAAYPQHAYADMLKLRRLTVPLHVVAPSARALRVDTGYTFHTSFPTSFPASLEVLTLVFDSDYHMSGHPEDVIDETGNFDATFIQEFSAELDELVEHRSELPNSRELYLATAGDSASYLLPSEDTVTRLIDCGINVRWTRIIEVENQIEGDEVGEGWDYRGD